MKLYLAQTSGQHFEAGPRLSGVTRALTSYHYYRLTDFDKIINKYFPNRNPDIFADSGAFSAMSQGVSILIDDYARWLKRWESRFTVYANLDVIGDAEATQRNQEYLEQEHGLSPLPVFHIGSDLSHLDRLADDYDYIALGGLVPHLRWTDRIMRWLIQCFKMVNGRANLHGFGCTNWTIIKSLPWHSVDSSAWTKGFRFGKLPVYDRRNNRFVHVYIGDDSSALKHRHLLDELGIQPEQISDRSKNTRQINAYVAAQSYQWAEEYLSERFESQSRIYLAEAGASLPSTLGAIQ